MTRLFKSALIAAPLAILSSTAFAGGFAEPVVTAAPTPVPIVAPTPVGRDWTGAYGGVSLGFGDVEADGVTGDFAGATFGGHVGYNYDLGSIVVGAELEAVGTNDFTNAASGLELENVLRAKVRAGYDAGAFLPYVTGGYAQATVSGDDDDGNFYGVGVDYAFSDNVTVGGEYLRHAFDDFNGGADITADTVSLRVSYNF